MYHLYLILAKRQNQATNQRDRRHSGNFEPCLLWRSACGSTPIVEVIVRPQSSRPPHFHPRCEKFDGLIL
jgi:hypothetical protein